MEGKYIFVSDDVSDEELKRELMRDSDGFTENDLKRNGEGYPDPTVYAAIKHMEKDSYDRYQATLHAIFNICDLAGFKITNRIEFVDRITGKIWR